MNKLEREIEYSHQFGLTKYRGKVATVFQKLVRVRAAAEPTGMTRYVQDGVGRMKRRQPPLVVCVTCGKLCHYKRCDGGHFMPRRHAATLLLPHNVHTQCKYCNDRLRGNLSNYHIFMVLVYGEAKVLELQQRAHLPANDSRGQLAEWKIQWNAEIRMLEKELG